MRKNLITILIIVFVAGAAYFGFKLYSGTKSAPTSVSEQKTAVTVPQTAPAVSSKTWTVEYKNKKFVPSEIKIKKGDTVTWTNGGSSPIWPASAIHPTHQVYPGFDVLKGLNTGESYSFTFGKVGSWRYHDHLNPSVTGVVEVSE